MAEMERGRAALLAQAAETFTRKVQQFPSVLEVALTGSLAAGDPWPYDLDLALALQDLQDLVGVAKAARQISSTTHAWDVFIFGAGPDYLGRFTVETARRGKPDVTPSTAGRRLISPTCPAFGLASSLSGMAPETTLPARSGELLPRVA